MYNNFLYKSGGDGLLLECLFGMEALRVMVEVYEGICGAHQPGLKMRWLLRRHNYYWPTMTKDCIEYARGCQACQKFGDLKHVSVEDLHSVIKHWPFRGWALDLIGKVSPPF